MSFDAYQKAKIYLLVIIMLFTGAIFFKGGVIKEALVGGSSVTSPALVINNLIGTKAVPITGSKTVIVSAGTDYDALYLNAQINVATTSAQTYTVTPYFSITPNCTASTTDTSINWFSKAVQTASSLVSTSTEPLVYSFGTTSSTTKSFQFAINTFGANCIKLVTVPSFATTTAWVEAIVKQQ